MDWDHFRYFLELARAGTLAGAARRLDVEHTTVSRRLQALEKQVGVALFAREAGGHRVPAQRHHTGVRGLPDAARMRHTEPTENDGRMP